MEPALDRFSHHPELRDRITDPLTSPSRSLTTAKLATLVQTRGLPADWWYASSGMCVSSSGTHSLAKGTRVSLTNLEDGALVTDFVEWFPGATIEKTRAVLEHAARSALGSA